MPQHEVQKAGVPSKKPGTVTILRRPIYKDWVLLQLLAIVFLADQFTKWLVREFLEFRESVPAEGFFRLTHTFNSGSAFGLFRDQNFSLILVSVVGITILYLIYRSQRQPGNLLRLSLGLQFGGAAGNLLDRVRLGHVTDFVDVGSWPIFNLADASIVIGLALLAWMFLISDGSKSNRAKSSAGSKNAAVETIAGVGAAEIPVNDPDPNFGITEEPESSLRSGAEISEPDDPKNHLEFGEIRESGELGDPGHSDGRE